jgi:hypothetical protein
MVGKAGSMLLCIGNLPARVTRRNLRAFVQNLIDGIDSRGLRLGSGITECSILRLTEPANGSVVYMGLVGVQPQRLGLRLIEQLRETPMKGARLDVRRYRHASFLGADTASATMSDLLGIVATKAADGTMSGPSPACRIDLVSSTGGFNSKAVDLAAGTGKGAYAH